MSILPTSKKVDSKFKFLPSLDLPCRAGLVPVWRLILITVRFETTAFSPLSGVFKFNYDTARNPMVFKHGKV